MEIARGLLEVIRQLPLNLSVRTPLLFNDFLRQVDQGGALSVG